MNRSAERILDPADREVADRAGQRVQSPVARVGDLLRAWGGFPREHSAAEDEVVCVRLGLVVDACQLLGNRFQARLFAELSKGGLREALTRLARSARQLPVASSVRMAHEEDVAAIVEHHRRSADTTLGPPHLV